MAVEVDSRCRIRFFFAGFLPEYISGVEKGLQAGS
jgi:hypothetical protein